MNHILKLVKAWHKIAYCSVSWARGSRGTSSGSCRLWRLWSSECRLPQHCFLCPESWRVCVSLMASTRWLPCPRGESLVSGGVVLARMSKVTRLGARHVPTTLLRTCELRGYLWFFTRHKVRVVPSVIIQIHSAALKANVKGIWACEVATSVLGFVSSIYKCPQQRWT